MCLKAAVINDDQDTIRAVFSKIACPTKAAVMDAIVVAASSSKVETLRILLSEFNEAAKSGHGKRQNHPMPIVGKKSLLCKVSGDVAVVLLDAFTAEQQDLEEALVLQARNGADSAIGAILCALSSMAEGPVRKRSPCGHREHMSNNLVACMTQSLCAAATGGHDGVVEQLLAARVRLGCNDLDSVAALRLACREGHTQVVVILLQEFSYEAETIDAMALVAAAAGKAETLHTTLAARPQPHVLQSLLLALAKAEQLESVVCILTELGVGSAVRADCGDMKVVDQMESVNSDSVDDRLNAMAAEAVDIALADAAGRGSPDAVRLLLAANADANALNGLPLQRASAIGCCATVRLLLDANAFVHVMNEAPLRAAMHNRHAPVTRVLMEAGADGTNVEDDLHVVCQAAALGGNDHRAMVFKDLKRAVIEECNYAANVLDCMVTNDTDQEHGLPSSKTYLQSTLATLRSEMQNAGIAGHGKDQIGRFSATMIKCVNAAQKLESKCATNFASRLKRKNPYAALVADAVLAALGMVLPKAQMDMIKPHCEKRVHERYHHGDALATAFQTTLAELEKKEKALDVAFILICESGVYAKPADVDALIVAVSHLFEPEKYVNQLSVLYAVYDLSVQRALKLGIPVNLLLSCIHSLDNLPGNGLTGKWAWCRLRRLCWEGPRLMSRYFEISLSPGNPGFVDAMRSFYEAARIADSAI